MDSPSGTQRPHQAGRWELAIPLTRHTLTTVLATGALAAHTLGLLSPATAGLLILALAAGTVTASQTRVRRR